MRYTHRSQDEGFTLIELLVVISIIGLLASVVMASLNSARTKAAYAKAQSELHQFAGAAMIAQGESGRRLQDITGNGCSDCICRGRDARNVATSDGCYIQWASALATIQAATGGTVGGITAMVRDPWGSPYMLDENERESGPTDCRMDSVRSAGPNGIDEVIVDNVCSGDDVCFFIPPSRSCP